MGAASSGVGVVVVDVEIVVLGVVVGSLFAFVAVVEIGVVELVKGIEGVLVVVDVDLGISSSSPAMALGVVDVSWSSVVASLTHSVVLPSLLSIWTQVLRSFLERRSGSGQEHWKWSCCESNEQM